VFAGAVNVAATATKWTGLDELEQVATPPANADRERDGHVILSWLWHFR
jgi:hypothetical protein